MDAQLLKWNDRVISVDLAKNVELAVVETDPGVKGNTQSGTILEVLCVCSHVEIGI